MRTALGGFIRALPTRLAGLDRGADSKAAVIEEDS